MKHYIKDGRLYFETAKATYVVIAHLELKSFQDFYVEDENGTFDLNVKPFCKPYDLQSTGYYNYFIYIKGEENDLSTEYLGEPTEFFSIEWAEKTINEYERSK